MSIRSPRWNSTLCGRLPRLWRLFPWRWRKTAVRPPSRPWRRSSPDRSRRRTLISASTASTREPTVSLVVCCLYPSSSACVLGSPAHIVSWHISFCELHGGFGQSRVFTWVFKKQPHRSFRWHLDANLYEQLSVLSVWNSLKVRFSNAFTSFKSSFKSQPFKLSYSVCVCVFVCMQVEVCFDCVLVLCFVMGNVLQFGEIVHHYFTSVSLSMCLQNVDLIKVELSPLSLPKLSKGCWCRYVQSKASK